METLEELITLQKTLQKEQETITNNLNKIKEKINKIEKNNKIENEIRQQKHITSLDSMHNYLLKNKVYCGNFNPSMGYAMRAYDIEYYNYKIIISNFNKLNFKNINFSCNTFDECENVNLLVVDKVTQPTTQLEKYLYPYIVKYMEPYLPITFEISSDHDGFRNKLYINSDIPLHIKLIDGSLSLTIYYLLQNERYKYEQYK